MNSVGVPAVSGVASDVTPGPGAFTTQVAFQTKTPSLPWDPFTGTLADVVVCGQLFPAEGDHIVVPVPNWVEVCDHLDQYHTQCYPPKSGETIHFTPHMGLDTVCDNLVVIDDGYFPDAKPSLQPVTTCLFGL